MAELVDALASGASVRMDVEVRVLFWAPLGVVNPCQSSLEFTLKLLILLGLQFKRCLLYTSPSPRDGLLSRMPSSA